MKIDISTLTKDIVLPITRAVKTDKKKHGWFSLIKRFWTFKREYTNIGDYIIWCEYINAFIFIPDLFKFDNASVPKVLNGIFKSDGLLLLGSLPHDIGYRYQGLILVNSEGRLYFKKFARKEIDEVLCQLSSWESGLSKSCRVATATLRVAGLPTWKGHAKNMNIIANDFPGLF